MSSQRDFDQGIDWEASLVAYKLQNLNSSEEAESIFQKSNYTGPLSLQEQLDILSEIPNNHYYLWSLAKDPAEQQVKFAQRFSTSTKYPCSSPRNRIINTVVFNATPSNIINALHVMLDLYNDSDVKGPPSKRRKCVFDKKKRVVVDTPYICNHLGIDEEEVLELSKNISSIATQKNKDEKLYLHYVEKLFSSGCLNWRVLKAPSLQIILMNNIDPMTGEFKVSQC